MSSLVYELQALALDSGVSVSDLLRRVVFVASKLSLSEVEKWVEYEMNGYPDRESIPPYRVVHGVVEALNPIRGWMRVQFEDSSVEAEASTAFLLDPISQIEALAKENGVLSLSAGPALRENIKYAIDVRVRMTQANLIRIVDTVRNRVLTLALELERQGVLGENMSFTTEEKTRARSQAINNWTVQNLNVGVMGDVSAGAAISAEQDARIQASIPVLKEVVSVIRHNVETLSAKERDTVEELVSGLEDEMSKPQPRSSLLKSMLSSIGSAATWTGKTVVETAISAAIKSLVGS